MRRLAEHEATPTPDPACPFCRLDPTRNTILLDGIGFVLMADYAPIAEGHVLLIPRGHYPCLGALPQKLEAEFEELKLLVGRFVKENFQRLTFWENGIIGQSVPHAHLHALSWSLDELRSDRATATGGLLHQLLGKATPCRTLSELRTLYNSKSEPYFYVEHDGGGHFLPPEQSLVSAIIETAGETRLALGLTIEERKARGTALTRALVTRWHTYRRALGS